MDRYEDYIAAGVHQLHNFVDAVLIVLHLDQAAEYPNAVIYMDYVVSKVEGTEVVEGKLLRFINAPADADSVEAVEYFVVCIAAYLILMVYEAGMDVLALYKRRKNGTLLVEHYGTKALQLGFLLSENIYFIMILKLFADIGNEKVEILVEDGLGRYIEFNLIFLLTAKGYIQIHFTERIQQRKKLPFAVHVRRVQPHGGGGIKKRYYAFSRFLVLTGGDVRINIGLVHFLYGELGVWVEGIYAVYLVAEITYAVGLFKGIGENVYDRSPYRILAGSGDKVHLIESLFLKGTAKVLVGKTVPNFYCKHRPGKFFCRRNLFLQGFRISYDE